MDFIPELDDKLSAEDKLKLLEQAVEQIIDCQWKHDERLVLSDTDVTLLRQLVAGPAPAVRREAVGLLGEYGPVTWADAERWTVDEDEHVRSMAFMRMTLSPYALAELCWTDKPRCVALFVENAKRYDKFSPDAYSLCWDDCEWVDLFWSQLGPLLDLGRPELSTNIICGFLEDFLVYNSFIALDDERLQSWIKGDSVERKMALLSVVQWFGMREPWQRELTEMLANDPAQVVSSTAKAFLAGKPVPDIQNREWAE